MTEERLKRGNDLQKEIFENDRLLKHIADDISSTDDPIKFLTDFLNHQSVGGDEIRVRIAKVAVRALQDYAVDRKKYLLKQFQDA